jgi:epoxyqueuosine reductase
MTTQPKFEQLLKEGCRLATVSTIHLADLQSEVEERRDRGEFDAGFSKEYMFRFKFTPPVELENAASLIVVAVPRPPNKAIFNWKGNKHSFILPPTYAVYDQKRIHIERLVKEAVAIEGYKIAAPNLPLKLLAARSGLAEYGRNNITYVNGMGSFMRLAAVYSDMPCESDMWHESKIMDSCIDCDICQRACPTGAIPKERFLLRSERCLTYHNEKEGKIPFPSWIKLQWHNCLIGCIRCQAVCPQNKPFLGQVEKTVEFGEEDIKHLLSGVSREYLSSSTLEKISMLGLTDYLNEMPRNLSVLLENCSSN